jgi:hypothetical protein
MKPTAIAFFIASWLTASIAGAIPISDDTPIGTRIKSERCYDEAQMRNYMLALEENKRDVDRVRSVCQNLQVCGMPGGAGGSDGT